MTPLNEIFSEVIGLAFGDVGLALIIFIASVAVLMWKANVPTGSMLMIGLPLMGALVMVVTDDSQKVFFFFPLGSIIFIQIGFNRCFDLFNRIPIPLLKLGD